MTCARLWAVEAARDGRLPGSEATLVGRHLETCRDCASESARLDALATALRALPAREPDAVSARREKQRLLAAIDTALVTPRRSGWRAAALVAAPAMALAIGVVLAAPGRPVATPLGGAVDARGAGTWSRHREGKVETVTLSDGHVSLRVRRSSPDERVIVAVPDGEIEDRGTTFSVEVARGFTQRISVDEGVVEYRRPGLPALVLSAGQSWAREPEPTRAAVAPPVTSAPSVDAPSAKTMSEPEGQPASTAPATLAPRHTPVTHRQREQAAAPSPSAPGTSDFGAGFRALADGRDRDAASLLGAAESGAADDARAEDAAYLRAVALARAGEREKAAAAARAYLERFPRGFRKAEVERLLK